MSLALESHRQRMNFRRRIAALAKPDPGIVLQFAKSAPKEVVVVEQITSVPPTPAQEVKPPRTKRVRRNRPRTNSGDERRRVDLTPRMRVIVHHVIDRYGLTTAEIAGDYRMREVCNPRHLIYYFMKRYTATSLVQIGRRLGGRDHTSILNGIRRIRKMTAADPKFAEEVALLESSLIEKLAKFN